MVKILVEWGEFLAFKYDFLPFLNKSDDFTCYWYFKHTQIFNSKYYATF